MVYASSEKEIEENYIVSARHQVSQIDDYITMYLKGLYQDCAFLALNESVSSADETITKYMDKKLDASGYIPMTPSQNSGIESEIYELYKSYALTHSEVVCVYIGTEDGGYIQWPESKLERQYDPRKRKWYEEIMSQSEDSIVTSAYHAVATNDLAVITTGKIVKDPIGQVVGIQAVDVSLDGLSELIKTKKIGQNGFVILTDSDGTILAHPKNPELNFTNISQMSGLETGQIKSREITMDHKTYVADIFTSDLTGWKYISLIEKDEITQSINRLGKLIVVLATGLTIVFAIIAYYFSTQFSTPLISAAKQLQRIESGDYSMEIPDELLSRNDDLGSFIKAVDSMQNVILDLMGKVENTKEIEHADMAFLDQIKEQTQNASMQVASALENFAKIAENEARSKEEIEKKLVNTEVSFLQAQKLAQIWTWEWDVENGTFVVSDIMRSILKLEANKTEYKIDEFMELIHPKDQSYFKKALNRMWNGDTVGIEFRYITSTNSEVWVYQSGNLVYNKDGKIANVQILNHDITERKETLKKLRKMNNNLRKIVKEEVEENRKKDAVIVYQSRLAKMGQMIGLITHQWKQPLNNLSLILANLKQASDYNELSESEINESVMDSNKIIQQMAQTIDDFRYFFNPNNTRESFSLNQSVNFAIELIEESVKLNNINIDTELKCMTSIVGYSNEFTQVLFNILDNAKDAMMLNQEVGRHIHIKSYDTKAHAVIEIFNNGNHIKTEVLENLFEPYFTTKSEEKGTGIGLYMSKMIIEKHMNGQIVCLNVDHGVMFQIRIPVNRVG